MFNRITNGLKAVATMVWSSIKDFFNASQRRGDIARASTPGMLDATAQELGVSSSVGSFVLCLVNVVGAYFMVRILIGYLVAVCLTISPFLGLFAYLLAVMYMVICGWDECTYVVARAMHFVARLVSAFRGQKLETSEV